MIDLSAHSHFVFDLDRTVWDTYSKQGQPIWAKQLVPPLALNDDGVIIDDVGSTCSLRQGIYEFLEALVRKKKTISFVSVGGIKDYPSECQPSLMLLKLFDILSFFNGHQYLLYRLDSKADCMANFGMCVLFDDNEKTRDEVNVLGTVCALRDSHEYPGDYYVG